MTPQSLNQLTREEYSANLGFFHSPRVMRKALQNSADVQRVATDLSRGIITEELIRQFVSTLVDKFIPGERFADDLALAALAVVLELRETDFSEDYLFGLARLKLAEIPIGIQVARECLKNRHSMPKNEVRAFRFAGLNDHDSSPFMIRASRFQDWPVSRSTEKFPEPAEVAK